MKIEQIVSEKQLAQLRELGVMNETALRNLRVREQFEALKGTRGARFAKYQLARMFRLGVHTIDAIVYPRA